MRSFRGVVVSLLVGFGVDRSWIIATARLEGSRVSSPLRGLKGQGFKVEGFGRLV